MIINKISLQQFLPQSEAEIQGHFHPAEANLGYFLAWFQHNLKALLSLNAMYILKYVLSCEQNCSYCDPD
jgi:hypothetical protein